jgi:hypothetical protein
MAKKQRDTATKRDDDQRATTDGPSTSDAGDGNGTASRHAPADGTELRVPGGGPLPVPDARPGDLRQDLSPDVSARPVGFEELDRKLLDAQMTEHTQTFTDPLGQTITRQSGPGVDEMLGRAGQRGLTTKGLDAYLPTEGKGTPLDLAGAGSADPGGNPSLYSDDDEPAGTFDESTHPGPFGPATDAEKEMKKNQDPPPETTKKLPEYVPPKKGMSNPDADPGGSSTVAGVGVTTPPVFKGDWVSHPVQGDGGDPPTRDPDPFQPNGGVMPGVVDKNPDYVETKIEGPPRVPQSQFTDGVNPRDDLTSGGPTGGGSAPHTGGDPDGMATTSASAPVGFEAGTAPGAVTPDAGVPDAVAAPDATVPPDAVAVSHGVPVAIDTGGAPVGFDAGDASAPQLSVDHVGDFGGPPPGAEDVDPGAQPGGLNDDGDGDG